MTGFDPQGRTSASYGSELPTSACENSPENRCMHAASSAPKESSHFCSRNSLLFVLTMRSCAPPTDAGLGAVHELLKRRPVRPGDVEAVHQQQSIEPIARLTRIERVAQQGERRVDAAGERRDRPNRPGRPVADHRFDLDGNRPIDVGQPSRPCELELVEIPQRGARGRPSQMDVAPLRHRCRTVAQSAASSCPGRGRLFPREFVEQRLGPRGIRVAEDEFVTDNLTRLDTRGEIVRVEPAIDSPDKRK